jgi:hypothetical protein
MAVPEPVTITALPEYEFPVCRNHTNELLKMVLVVVKYD